MRCLAIVVLGGLLMSCSSISYDLGGLPFPVSASPAPADERCEPFEIREKAVLWVHGLFGSDQPDVRELLREQCGDASGVYDFRVDVGATGHDWFLTHLTLTLVRLKTVTIRGQVARRGRE